MRPVREQRGAGRCRLRALAALLAAMGIAAPALARDIAIGSYLPDFSLKAEGEVHYTLGLRTESPDAALYRNPNYTQADLEYGHFSLNMARLDLSGSAELQYQDWAGFRLSAASWMDNAFGSAQKSPPADTPPLSAPNFLALFDLPTPPARTSFPVQYGQIQPYTKGSDYNDYVQRWEGGPSAELRDLFVWGNFAYWRIPFNVKLGRYSAYWGESLFDGVDGISYAQGPVDLERALREPGIEARQLQLPLPQIGLTAQPTPSFSFGLQYLLGWAPSRLPPAGTYFGVPYPVSGSDAQLFGGTSYPTDNQGGGLPMVIDYKGYDKPGNGGSFGLYLKFRPDWLWGVTSALYYRRADETLPWLLESPVKAIQGKPYIICFNEKADPFPLCAALTGSQAYKGYNAVYNRGMQIIGLSFEKNFRGMTFGSDIVMRRGTALQTLLAPSPSFAGYGPDTSPTTPPADLIQGEGARGNTVHALLNVTGALRPRRYWDSFEWKAEVGFAHLVNVSQNSFLYAGEGYGGCTLGPLAGNPAGFRSTLGTNSVGTKADGCASSTAVNAHVAMAPAWNDVLRPGLNLSLPISFAEGVMGNSPVLGGGQAGTGAYSLGLAAQYRRRYDFGIAYNDYLSRVHTINGVSVDNAVNPLGTGAYNDRGWVSMTFKMAF